MPTESRAHRWVEEHQDANPYLRCLRAARQRQADHDAAMKRIEAQYRKRGLQYCMLVYGKDPIRIATGPVGLRTTLQVLRDLGQDIKQQGIRRLVVGNLRDFTYAVDRYRRKYHARVEQYPAVCLVDQAPPPEVRQVSSEAPGWFMVPKDTIRDAMERFRQQLDCPTNSEDHLRLVLMPYLKDRVMDTVIQRLDKIDGPDADYKEFNDWWGGGFGDTRVSLQCPDHPDVVALAHQLCDHILKKAKSMTEKI